MSFQFEQMKSRVSCSIGVCPPRDRKRQAGPAVRRPAAFRLEQLEPRLALSASTGEHPAAKQASIVGGSPLTYGVVQPVSQLGSMQVADGSLKQNDGTNPAFPKGSYTIWLSPTLPAGVPATNWIPTPSTAYLQSIYGSTTTVNTTIEPILRMYYPQPGNLPPSALPLPRGYGSPKNPKLPSTYVIPPIVTQAS